MVQGLNANNVNYGQTNVSSKFSQTDKNNLMSNRMRDIGSKRSSAANSSSYYPPAMGSAANDSNYGLSQNFKKASGIIYPLGTAWRNAAGKVVGFFRVNFGAMLGRDNYSDNYDIA